jgi:hypothetical protein
MELIASAFSKLLSSNGKLSTEPRRRSTQPLWIAIEFRAQACSTISRDRSIPATFPFDAVPVRHG